MSLVNGDIRFGLIGLGRHGSRYARHLIEGVHGCRLAAVSRRDAVDGRAFGDRHGITFFPDWRELVTQPTVDAVLVVTPPALNRNICLAAVSAGKPVLIEKPLALRAAEAQTMVLAARQAGVPLMTAQTLRFTPVLARLRARMPAIGALEYLSLTMRAERPPHEWLEDPAQAGGGVLLEIGIHLLDLIRFLTGEEAVKASALCERRHTTHVEDMALARITLASGIHCYIDVSRVSGGRVCRVEAVGQTGQLIADVDRGLLVRIADRDIVETETVPDRPTIATVLNEFVRSLSMRTPVPVTGEDGLLAVAMAESCYLSASEGREVTIPPFLA